ncbi:hypothetical protein L1987_65920 [Smallanthus sonchifolius]|uniref:Uncharacterized protein n=1 Tax=Smallanthus sonchifolius TaxID=185202 RepID=A0ACB9BVX3_9ASTR|nr:hypothetical protein L1987_65920 [Smallanthus sonchifolius]
MQTVDEEQREEDGQSYQTTFLRSPEGRDLELVLFRGLDHEFNKVVHFYKTKVEEVVKQAEELSNQMDALIALRIKVNNRDNPRAAAVSPFINETNTGSYPLDAIHEEHEKRSDDHTRRYKMASLEVLDRVAKLIGRVESVFVKHFCNGNRNQGMNTLRPKAKREKHRLTFFVGCFFGFSLALVVAIIASVRARYFLKREGRTQYMNTIFPLYSLFGFVVLHMLIFGLSVLTLAAALANLEMELDPTTKSYKVVTELLPLALLIVVLLIIVCPFDIFYRANRFFFLVCLYHCICAPLYSVTLPDFFLADQFTSQVQLLRNLQFYVCYYGWGDFKKRNAETCNNSDVYDIFLYLLLLSHIGFDSYRYILYRVATVFSTYWDIVMDWGLLCRNSENPWLRDKLILPNKSIYFIAMVLNVILRLAWMQTVMDFHETPSVHRNALIAIFASLEIIRRCIWNFFRLENEHLNNVGKFRAVKSVPLPFSYEDGYKNL